MMVSIAFRYEDNIYHAILEERQKITFGSGKKDTVQVPFIQAGQIILRWDSHGIMLSSKGSKTVKKQMLGQDDSILLSEAPYMSVFISSDAGEEEEHVDLPYNCTLRIGRSEKNDIVLHNGYVSGKHLIIRSEDGTIRMENVSKTHGTYLNGKKISQAKLHSGDVLSILTIKITLENRSLIFENTGSRIKIKKFENQIDLSFSEKSKGILPPGFRRSPRIQEQLPTEEIVLAAPPSKPSKFEKRRGFAGSLLGTGAMVAASAAMGTVSPAFMAARAASLVAPIANIGAQSGNNKRQKKKIEEYERMRRERYGQYIAEQKARIQAVADAQRKILSAENPSPEECMQTVLNVSRNLWERSSTDRDFLDVRIGMGYEDICVPVKSFVNESCFQMEDDDVKKMAEEIIEETRIVDYVPSRLKLRKYRTVGIIGERRRSISLVRNILVGLTAAHFYKEVKIVGIFDEKEKREWTSLRWLPHVWDEHKQSKYLAFDRTSAHHLCEMMKSILEEREKNLDQKEGSQDIWRKQNPISPHYIFLLGSREYIEQEEIIRKLVNSPPELGISSIFLFDRMESLPYNCQFIVDMNNSAEFTAYEHDKANKRIIFTMDKEVSRDQFDMFARRMSAIEIKDLAETEEIPVALTFLQGYGVRRVQELDAEQRWKNSKPYLGLGAPVGMMKGNKPFVLDISGGDGAHGPHGLVAGTTGSGKSEFLQTWILSMALNYHPWDVTFVLIDYKGGGMANSLIDLPHVVGTITNIGSNIERSLHSLESEANRRQKLFERYSRECGIMISSIEKYQRLYREGRIPEALPHLVIVADEFAELKENEPNFISGLISVARIGRSLGIHLILATQKPTGVVNEQIWSNSRFRICLKVQDGADSREMLKRPDAAGITMAGRAYVQVGANEIFELFQSCWSGAQYSGASEDSGDMSNRVRVVLPDGTRLKTVVDERTRFRSEETELTAIVRYLNHTAQKMGIVKLQGPWLKELPERLPLLSLMGEKGFNGQKWPENREWLKIPVGMFDLPEIQSQGIQYMDFQQTPNIGIYGAPYTGKTTLLKTAVFSAGLNYSPEEVQIYVIDCGGWNTSVLKEMPHVGDVILDSEEEKMGKFQKMILEEMERRKEIFYQHHISSLNAYRKFVGKDMAAWIIAVDNLPALFELYPDMESTFITLTSSGASCGMYLMFTANSRSGIRYKVQQNVSWAITFELTDKNEYIDLVGSLQGKKLPPVMGRAFAKGNPPAVFQAAIFMDGEDDVRRAEALQTFVRNMNRSWNGIHPARIPVMPDRVTLEEMEDWYTVRNIVPLGVGYEDLSPAYCDMSERYSLIVSGSIGSGKSSYLSEIAGMICRKYPENRLYVFDGAKGSLRGLEHVSDYGKCTQAERMSVMMKEIAELLTDRMKKRDLYKNENPEKFSAEDFLKEYEHICIVIDDLKEFVEAVSNKELDIMERVCRYAQGLGVLVFAAVRTADLSYYSAIEKLTIALLKNQKGLVLDGTASLYHMFNNNLDYMEKNVELRTKEAYFFDDGKCIKIKRI